MALSTSAATSAGALLYVAINQSTVPTAGTYPGLSWVVVGEVTDIGAFGKSYKLVTHNPIASRLTVKRKGSYNNGTIALKMARVSNQGQTDLVTASTSDLSAAFKVVFQSGALTAYFTGQVMSAMTNIGNVDTITGLDVNVELDSDVIEL